MAHRTKSAGAAFAALIIAIGLAACANQEDPLPQPSPPSPSGDRDLSASAPTSISIGEGARLITVPVDANITQWLNTIHQESFASPEPEPGEWHDYRASVASETVTIDTSAETPLDLLEILAYPDGLNEHGVPISTEVHPLCGPHADVTCSELQWNATGIEIPRAWFDTALEGTEYFAIGGICLPNGDSYPPSFMVLMKKSAADR